MTLALRILGWALVLAWASLIVTLTEADQVLVATIEGVGTVSAAYQVWGRIDGAPWVKIGTPVEISGTVTYDEENEEDVFVSDTNTFTTLATDLYAELLRIEPAGSTFLLTQTDVPPN